MLLQLLALGLALLLSQTATAALSLIQPSSDTTHLNTTLPHTAFPKEPLRLVNHFVHPPIAVTFKGYGDLLPRTAAKTCVSSALTHAFNTSDHKMLSPIHEGILDYTTGNVALSFHRYGVVYWEEWQNALYLVSKFVDDYVVTREFFYWVEISEYNVWRRVGRGSLIGF